MLYSAQMCKKRLKIQHTRIGGSHIGFQVGHHLQPLFHQFWMDLNAVFCAKSKILQNTTSQ